MTDWHLRENDVVVIRAFDDIPEHLFRVWEVLEDCITGYAISGPLEGAYPLKPKWMRWHTYLRIRAKSIALEKEIIASLKASAWFQRHCPYRQNVQ